MTRKIAKNRRRILQDCDAILAGLAGSMKTYRQEELTVRWES